MFNLNKLFLVAEIQIGYLRALPLAVFPSKSFWRANTLFKLFLPWGFLAVLLGTYAAHCPEKNIKKLMFWDLFTFLESGLLRCISVLLYFIVPLTSVFENHGLKRLYCKSRSGPGNTRGRSGYLEGFRNCWWSPGLSLFKSSRKNSGTIRNFGQRFLWKWLMAKMFVQHWHSQCVLFCSKKGHQSEASLAFLDRCSFSTLPNQLLTCLNLGIIALLEQRLTDCKLCKFW